MTGLRREDERIHVPIVTPADIIRARSEARRLAEEAHFAPLDVVAIATAVSELARNILTHAGVGEIQLWSDKNPGARLAIEAVDQGPGIADVEQALQPGFTTSGGLGMGLPGVRRLVDEFVIVSEPGKGTRVMVVKQRAGKR